MADPHGHSPPGIFLRGMLMGAADIVPGVSGGTMAFITGIYDRLLAAISAVDLGSLRLLRKGQWREAWIRVDANFLLVLACGIAVSVFSLARVISHWLESEPLRIWSFFFGLIFASALLLVRHVRRWSPPAVGGMLFAACVAVVIALAPALALPVTPLTFFIAGFLASCAMILPGISGSFILVLLGMYAPVLATVEGLIWQQLLLLLLGIVCGLLSFSRLLHYLLQVHYSATLATLTGFLAGSLPMVWPWKGAVEEGSGRGGLPVWPTHYAAGDSQLLLCVALMVSGTVAVWLLESRWGALDR